MVLIFLFMYAPIFLLMVFSFNSSKSRSVWTGFSLKWYKALFSDAEILHSIKITLMVAVCAAVISTILGTAAAIGIFAMKKYPRRLVMTVNNIPTMNPDIIMGVSLMLLFVFVGRLVGAANSLSFITLLIAHITFNLPYVILNVLPKLNQTDSHLVEAAQDLGSTPTEAFFRVILPAIMPGVTSGLLMAFTLSLDDFVISYYTTGSSFQTLPLLIFSMTKKAVKPDMYALSTIIFVTVLVLLLAVNIGQIKAAEKNEKHK